MLLGMEVNKPKSNAVETIKENYQCVLYHQKPVLGSFLVEMTDTLTFAQTKQARIKYCICHRFTHKVSRSELGNEITSAV